MTKTTDTNISKLEPYLQSTGAFAITDAKGREHYYHIEQVPGTIVYRVYSSRSGHGGYFIGTVHRFDRLQTPSPYSKLGTQYDPAPMPSRETTYYSHWAAFHDWLKDPDAPSRLLGYCRRCGRLLTDPRAITRGYGDECFKHIEHTSDYRVVTPAPCDTCYYRFCTYDEELLCYNCPIGLTFLDGYSSCDCQRRHREMEQTGNYTCDMYTPRKGAHNAK